MKHLLTYILLSAFLFQICSKAFIFTDYLINKKYIAAVLCENKNKPKMHCNGKCHLKKQLEKEEKNESKSQNNIKEKQETLFFLNYKIVAAPLLITEQKFYLPHYLMPCSLFIAAVFRPPIA